MNSRQYQLLLGSQCENLDLNLCIVIEYSLRNIHKPLGVAEYEAKIIDSLLDNFKGSLSTIQEIEENLE